MANYVTFRIVETRNGEWKLYLHNHGRRLVSEKFRSKDLDEAVKKLKGQVKYRQHFNNALSNEIMFGRSFLEGDE